MDAETPATPLEKAVEEAREVLAGHPVSVSNPRNPRVAAEDALRSLLAALYADRGEAEATLRPFADFASIKLTMRGTPLAGEWFAVESKAGAAALTAGDFARARRYFARREEKGEKNRG